MDFKEFASIVVHTFLSTWFGEGGVERLVNMFVSDFK